MGNTYLITSGKGGVGKSTLACNVASYMAQRDKKVVLVDMDMGLRSLDILLGLENRVVYDIADVADGLCRVRQALIRAEDTPNLYLMPASQTRDGAAVSADALERAVRRLAEKFDCVVLDCPAGVGRGFQNTLGCVEKAVIVACADVVSLRDAERVSGLIEKAGVQCAGVVLNRVSRKSVAADWPASPEKFAQQCRTEVIGLIPEDPRMSEMASKGRCAVLEDAVSAEAFRRVARRMMGEKLPLEPFSQRGFLDRVKDKFRRKK